MRWAAVVLVLALVAEGCGSRKRVLEEQIRNDVRLEFEQKSRLQSELNVLELLDVDFRQVEKKDSNGNVEKVTDVKILRNREEKKVEAVEEETKGTEEDRSETERQEKEKRSSPVKVWMLVVGGAVALGGVVYLKKKGTL